MADLPPTQPDLEEPPTWDREAARARYRRLMRSWPMRLMYLLLIVTILFAWVWGIAAAVAPSVENLPGHDVTVPPRACVQCHTVGAAANNAPPINHPIPPTCAFCHRQSPPQGGTMPGGWAQLTRP